MNSLSKNRLSFALINTLSLRAFGEPALRISEIESGCFSALYRVGTAEREAVLKVSPKDGVRVLRYEKDAMRAEVGALRLVRARTDVPVPTVLFYDASRDFGDFEYFFMERMSGAEFSALSPNLSAGENSRILSEMGRLNRRVNGIIGEKFGYPARLDRQSESWKTAFEGIIGDILADGKDAGFALPVPYAEIEDVIARFSPACADVKTPRLIHWDLWPGNVLAENGEISGIVDWERALWADPLMEYAFREKPPNKDFLAGYGADFIGAGKDGRNDRSAAVRLALYDLYLALVWKIECRYRGYKDSPQNGWSEGKIAEACAAFAKLQK
ncbi:MAG: aminoglycoside phosphotransferase family protein [Firmicutes bacterium]|nr:aminoglycoside phosphotransferase family protein [Bacillota bacterium]